MTEYIDKIQLIQRIKQEPTDGMYIEEILSAVDEIETADVAEVRHGKWEKYSHTMDLCSDCRRHVARHHFNYCPWCGARMGDDEE